MHNILKIVIIDDNKEFCEILSEYFSLQPDMEVVGATTKGDSVLDLILRNDPDIVIMDILMPGTDGISLLKQIKSSLLNNHIKFIILSALDNNRKMKDIMDLGISYYFVKPIDLEFLTDQIRELVHAQNRA